MAYQLKSTGIAANCTMLIAVDPDTGTIKDFASSSVTADITVGANVTISEQAWDGITRKYFVLGSGTAADDFVAFGTTKPQWDFNSGESRTVVFIGEAAGSAVRVIGGSSATYFASQNLSGGGATFPTLIAGSTITGGQAALTAGQKRIFGFSLVYGTSSTVYYAADTDASMGSASLAALSPAGTTYDYAVGYVGRRNDSTAHQQDKIHAVLIFDTALSESDFDALRDDWFTTLLESAGGGASVSVPAGSLVLTGNAPTVSAGGAASVSVPSGSLSLSGYAPTVSNGGASDIQLQPALDLLSGADAASLSGLRWIAFAADYTIAHSGSGLSLNSSGQATIDINASDFTVGDWVLTQIFDPDASEPTEADRVVGVFLGWVEAVAQA